MSNIEAFNKIMSEIGEQLNEETINAIKTVLEAKDEPVAWRRFVPEEGVCIFSEEYKAKWQPLYTVPPQRKPLTDEQIEKICRAVDGDEFPIDFCREIEAAHGIK